MNHAGETAEQKNIPEAKNLDQPQQPTRTSDTKSRTKQHTTYTKTNKNTHNSNKQKQ